MSGLIRVIPLLIAVLCAVVGVAQAQTRSLTEMDADSSAVLPEPSLEARVIEDLRSDGYVRIQRTGTLLGRVRITGLQAGVLREIVLNPYTREILRDVEFQADGSPVLGTGGGDSGRLNAN